jgi:hypothetical protein
MLSTSRWQQKIIPSSKADGRGKRYLSYNPPASGCPELAHVTLACFFLTAELCCRPDVTLHVILTYSSVVLVMHLCSLALRSQIPSETAQMRKKDNMGYCVSKSGKPLKCWLIHQSIYLWQLMLSCMSSLLTLVLSLLCICAALL